MINKLGNDNIDIIKQMVKKIDNYDNINLFSDPFVNYYGYFSGNLIIGFISYSIIYERSELNYIYVENECRNRGIASELIEFMINDCLKNKCLNITLEVNEKNIKAICLYNKYEFKQVAIRKNYYYNNDGIMMERILVIK